MSHYILAIDQGTTSSRAIVFDQAYQICGVAQQEIKQIFPRSGWVEHNPLEVFSSCIDTARAAISNAGLTSADISAIGITNQRETTIVWNKTTGQPIYNAIVWQDRRTADFCQQLKDQGHEAFIRDTTGLLLDPYFSGTKVNWILNHVDGAREQAQRGELLFGTVDCWLLWQLTDGTSHATDATNASRTLLFNIKTQQWDQALLKLLDVPENMLPDVRDCAADFGKTAAHHLGTSLPVYGMAGDQQAASLGQACFDAGMMKSTYGTGCFALLNTGERFVPSSHRLLTTVAYRLEGTTHYALEGSIFMAGATIQWLRDQLGIIQKASECDALAEAADPDQAVYLVPAFTGMGAPYWEADARGLLCGMTRASGREEIVRASLEAVCYQTADLLKAMQDDWLASGADLSKTVLRVDGGMSASDWTMQFLADIIDAPVDRPMILETTALGAAWLAGQYAGVWDNAASFANSWRLDQQFTASMSPAQRQLKTNGWQQAVQRCLCGLEKNKD